MSRIRTLKAGSDRTRMLAAAIRAAADSETLSVVRIQHRYDRANRPYWRVLGYTLGFEELYLDADAQEAISNYMRALRPDIAWQADHDVHLDTGMLRRSPLPEEPGFDPEGDGTFGGTDPVFGPRIPATPTTEHQREAA